MVKVYFRVLRMVLLGSCLVFPVAVICSRILANYTVLSPGFLCRFAPLLGFAIALYALSRFLLGRAEPAIERISQEQTGFLDAIHVRWLDVAVLASAGLSLFLELAVIRWQGTEHTIFSFYKNIGLLSCFAGLGLGYALAGRDRIPLFMVIPLLAWQIGFLTIPQALIPEWLLKSLMATPVSEQLNMGFDVASSGVHYAAIYLFLIVIFLLTALTFIPVGQLCGRLMERRGGLRAYGFNLLGSLLGVLLMLAISYLWTPPVVWFIVCLAGILIFLAVNRSSLLWGTGLSLGVIVILVWPTKMGWERIYSPYQLIERGQDERGQMVIRSAGLFFQKIHDFSRDKAGRQSDPGAPDIVDYYELPYRLHGSAGKVAVVGAGTGNDVAAALLAGAKQVDAIEIDPAIMKLGAMYHPERPYTDTKVRTIVNDARSFFRTTNERYDLIVYGLLDSHTLLSHASSVRLDSFVYTVEGIGEARSRLKKGGTVSLSFCTLTPELGRKIYLMMKEAFDGRAPVCLRLGTGFLVTFVQSADGQFAVPPEVLEQTGFKDCTAEFANTALKADASTDNWPFFYMPKRVYPVSYVIVLGLVVVLYLFLNKSFISERPRFSHAAFFFLGAGFMLVETKGITELGLSFGNTWHVIGIVISGILIMAFCANCVVQWLQIRNPMVPFLLLIVSLLIGLAVSSRGGFASTAWGRLAAVSMLTCPLFFSGIAFSSLLNRTSNISGAMAMNLLGAMCGGLLEYNAMYFGFRFLYVIAACLYLVALACWVLPRLKLVLFRRASLVPGVP